MSDKQMKKEAAELDISLAVMRELFEQVMRDCDSCNRPADVTKIERLVKEYDRMQAELKPRLVRFSHEAMAKAGLLPN